jgi:hypothetical protein
MRRFVGAISSGIGHEQENSLRCKFFVFILFSALLAAPCLTAEISRQERFRNQLQNASFEEDWLISDALARRRWGLIARAEAGYAGADGKSDHWEAPVEWRDAGHARSGRFSIKLVEGRKLTQSARAAMRSPAKGNPASSHSNFKPLDPADLAKLEPRTVRGGAWIKANDLPENAATISIAAGKQTAQAAVPAGTFDWRLVEVVSPEPWPAAEAITIAIQCNGGAVWVDDAFLGEDARGANLAVNGDFEKLDAKGWPAGWSSPEAFWWFRFDYYSWTGWSHDGGYGCQLAERIDLVPGYTWRGKAELDSLVSHSGRNSMRLTAYPGDNFGVIGPAVNFVLRTHPEGMKRSPYSRLTPRI